MDYELTEEDVDHLDLWVVPLRMPVIMRAACDPDSRYLSALLRHGGFGPRGSEGPAMPERDRASFDPNVDIAGSEDGHWLTTPLLTAVECGNLDNVKVLVEAGANPNGVDLDMLKDYASQWIRLPEGVRGFEDFSSSTKDELLENPAQRDPIHEDEWTNNVSMTISSGEIIKFGKCIVPFWTRYPEYDSWDRNDDREETGRQIGNAPMTSLMKAAHTGNIEMFDLLLDLGADASYWRQPTFEWPGSRTPSSTARSTPLHLAIQAGHAAMVEHLLQSGFNPNILPMVNPVTAATPLMASVVCHAAAPRAYQILSTHPDTNFDVRTPYCNIHVAQFAVASNNVEALEDICRRTSFDFSARTNLRQNCLHIAFLPADNMDIFDSRKKRASVRNRRAVVLPYMRSSGGCVWEPHRPRMLEWLSARCADLVGETDVYGNTPLHYHACSWEPFKSLPQSLRDHEATRRIWDTTKNSQQLTSQELSEA